MAKKVFGEQENKENLQDVGVGRQEAIPGFFRRLTKGRDYCLKAKDRHIRNIVSIYI